jgi:hypothetical protein
MKFLRRIVPPSKIREQENNAKESVHRRVEVTVDRELVSILIPARRPDAPDESRLAGKPIAQVPERPPAHEAAGSGNPEDHPPP